MVSGSEDHPTRRGRRDELVFGEQAARSAGTAAPAAADILRN